MTITTIITIANISEFYLTTKKYYTLFSSSYLLRKFWRKYLVAFSSGENSSLVDKVFIFVVYGDWAPSVFKGHFRCLKEYVGIFWII